jgi:hypothetical protein
MALILFFGQILVIYPKQEMQRAEGQKKKCFENIKRGRESEGGGAKDNTLKYHDEKAEVFRTFH